jgi:hypothetical protein
VLCRSLPTVSDQPNSEEILRERIFKSRRPISFEISHCIYDRGIPPVKRYEATYHKSAITAKNAGAVFFNDCGACVFHSVFRKKTPSLQSSDFEEDPIGMAGA